MDLLAQIDELTESPDTCGRCGRALSSSVSDDFCSESCQSAWAAAWSEPLPRDEEDDDAGCYSVSIEPDTSRFVAALRQAELTRPADVCTTYGHQLRSGAVSDGAWSLSCDWCDAEHDELIGDIAASGDGIFEAGDLVGVRLDAVRRPKSRRVGTSRQLDGRGRVCTTYR